MIAPCAEIAKNIGSLFSCSEVNGYLRIRTPYIYPDGDVVDLFLSQGNGDAWLLTDLGETARWLRMQTTSAKRTGKQSLLIEDVCVTHRVEFVRGALTVRGTGTVALAEAVMRLAQACLRVSDLWFTFRNRSVLPITDEVADFLSESSILFDRGQRFLGGSGRMWPVDFKTTAAMVQVLTTGTRGASHPISEHTFAGWYDLRHMRSDSNRFVTLFDDTADVWAHEDILLLQEVSDIAYWTRPDDFRLLVA